MQRTASCFIQSATTGFTAKGFLSHYRVSPKEAFKGPEPDDGKPSRPVLRGPAPSNGGWLLGSPLPQRSQRKSNRGDAGKDVNVSPLSNSPICVAAVQCEQFSVLHQNPQ